MQIVNHKLMRLDNKKTAASKNDIFNAAES